MAAVYPAGPDPRIRSRKCFTSLMYNCPSSTGASKAPESVILKQGKLTRDN
jgi:hypothetical protein